MPLKPRNSLFLLSPSSLLFLVLFFFISLSLYSFTDPLLVCQLGRQRTKEPRLFQFNSLSSTSLFCFLFLLLFIQAMDHVRGFILLVFTLFLLLLVDASDFVFPVERKFKGPHHSLDAIKTHDANRRGRFLSAAEIPLGGNGLPSSTGFVSITCFIVFSIFNHSFCVWKLFCCAHSVNLYMHFVMKVVGVEQSEYWNKSLTTLVFLD